MAKSLAILQSSYIPWKGYFDLMRRVDEFIFLENVQMTAQDWRSRNYIKSPAGPLLLSVPYLHPEHGQQNIEDVLVDNRKPWAKKHFRSLHQIYVHAPYFGAHREWIEQAYLHTTWTRLSELNIFFMTEIAGRTGIPTTLRHSREFSVTGTGSDRILHLCMAAGATRYLSGPAAKSYLNLDSFARQGIAVEFMTYEYPPYSQLHGEFTHTVSVLDLLFMTGPDAPRYIWGDIARDYRAARLERDGKAGA